MSARIDYRGPYMGFTYNGVHSSDLGIVRVSDGSRFNENLLPTMQDKTVQVPGGDGTYYFGSYYTQRQFNVSFAFDDLTEQEVAELKRHFGDKKIHDLIFDETPYKVWSAKVTGTATIKYIPFAEGDVERLYKGEGSIQFTCYYPFARCRFTTKQEYINVGCENIDEWWEASRIGEGGNFGDIPVPFTLYIPKTGTIKKLEIGTTVISWETLPQSGTLNTKTGLVLADDGKTILNRYFTGDLTVKLPVGGTRKIVNGQSTQFTCLYI